MPHAQTEADYDWLLRVENVFDVLQKDIVSARTITEAERLRKRAQWLFEKAHELEQLALSRSDDLVEHPETVQAQADKILAWITPDAPCGELR